MAHVSCSRFTEVIDLPTSSTIRTPSYSRERLIVDVDLSANVETPLRSPCSVSPTFNIADILTPPFDHRHFSRVELCSSPTPPSKSEPSRETGSATMEELESSFCSEIEQQNSSNTSHELQNMDQNQLDKTTDCEQPTSVHLDGFVYSTKPDPMLIDSCLNNALELQSSSSVVTDVLEAANLSTRDTTAMSRMHKTCSLTRSEIFRIDISQEDETKISPELGDKCSVPKTSPLSLSLTYDAKVSPTQMNKIFEKETEDGLCSRNLKHLSSSFADTLDNLIDAARCVYAEAQLEEAESVLDRLLSKFAAPSDLYTAWDNLPSAVQDTNDRQLPSYFSPIFKILLSQPESNIFPELCNPTATGRQLQDLCNQLAFAIRRTKRKLRLLQKMRARQGRTKNSTTLNGNSDSLTTTDQTQRRSTFLEKLKDIWPGPTSSIYDNHSGARMECQPLNVTPSRECSKVYSNPLKCPLSLLSFVTNLTDPSVASVRDKSCTDLADSENASTRFSPQPLSQFPGELAIQVVPTDGLADSGIGANWANSVDHHQQEQSASSFESPTSTTLSMFSSSVSPSSCSTASCGRTPRPSKCTNRRRMRGKVTGFRGVNQLQASETYSPRMDSKGQIVKDSSKSPPICRKRSACSLVHSPNELHLTNRNGVKTPSPTEVSPTLSSSSPFYNTTRFGLPSPTDQRLHQNIKYSKGTVSRRFGIQPEIRHSYVRRSTEPHTNGHPPSSSHGGSPEVHTESDTGESRLFHDHEEMSTCSSEDRSLSGNRPPTPDVRRSDLDLLDLSDGTRILVIQDTHLRAGTLFLHKQIRRRQANLLKKLISSPTLLKTGGDISPANKRDQLFRIHLDGERPTSVTLHPTSVCKLKHVGSGAPVKMRCFSSPARYHTDFLSVSPSSAVSSNSNTPPKKGRQSDLILYGWQVVQQAVLEVVPSSMSHLPPGTRVCAAWSKQLASNLYPGTVVEAVRDEVVRPGCVAVDFDDGDHRQVLIDNIRLLPDHFTNLYQLANETSGKGLVSPFLQATSPSRRSFIDPFSKRTNTLSLKRRIRHHSTVSVPTQSTDKKAREKLQRRFTPSTKLANSLGLQSSELTRNDVCRFTSSKASFTDQSKINVTESNLLTASSCLLPQGVPAKFPNVTGVDVIPVNTENFGNTLNTHLAPSAVLSASQYPLDPTPSTGMRSDCTVLQVNGNRVGTDSFLDNDVSSDTLSTNSSFSDSSTWHILEKVRRRKHGQVYCRSVERESDGMIVSVGDTVEFSSGHDEVYLGLVRSIRWDDSTDSPFVIAAWFYSPQEAGSEGQRILNIKGALFATEHVDENEARCIRRHAMIFPTYAEYRRQQLSDDLVTAPGNGKTSGMYPNAPLYPNGIQVQKKTKSSDGENPVPTCLEKLPKEHSTCSELARLASNPNGMIDASDTGPYFIAGKYDPVNRRVLYWDPDIEKLITRRET